MIKMKTDRQTRSVIIEGRGGDMIEKGLKKALQQIGEDLQKEIRRGIKEPPKTGRIYQGIQASRGRIEYPANRTGKLARSINFKVKSDKKMIIGSSAPYGVFLEDGTSNMEARKLIIFTINKKRDKIRDLLRKNVNSELKG